MLILCYVDDCFCVSKSKKKILNLIKDLKENEKRKHVFDLDLEEDMAGFLGIPIEKTKDGKTKLLQTGLIDCILKVLNLEEANGKDTPAASK